MLRRSLTVWGWGQLAIGDPRGWVLLALEAAWLAVFGLSLTLIATDHWLIAYALLAGFIVTWVGQAVAAYRGARARSGLDTGAAWLLVVAPFVIALLTGFWLFAGSQATPAATFQHYIGAWRHGDTGAAVDLFAQAQDPDALAARWKLDESLIAARIHALATADPEFNLDDENPDTNLRYDEHDPGVGVTVPADGPVQFDVEVIREVTVPSTFFGLVPASATETRIVEVLGTATLIRRPADGPLAVAGASIWLIQSLHINGEP